MPIEGAESGLSIDPALHGEAPGALIGEVPVRSGRAHEVSGAAAASGWWVRTLDLNGVPIPDVNVLARGSAQSVEFTGDTDDDGYLLVESYAVVELELSCDGYSSLACSVDHHMSTRASNVAHPVILELVPVRSVLVKATRKEGAYGEGSHYAILQLSTSGIGGEDVSGEADGHDKETSSLMSADTLVAELDPSSLSVEIFGLLSGRQYSCVIWGPGSTSGVVGGVIKPEDNLIELELYPLSWITYEASSPSGHPVDLLGGGYPIGSQDFQLSGFTSGEGLRSPIVYPGARWLQPGKDLGCIPKFPLDQRGLVLFLMPWNEESWVRVGMALPGCPRVVSEVTPVPVWDGPPANLSVEVEPCSEVGDVLIQIQVEGQPEEERSRLFQRLAQESWLGTVEMFGPAANLKYRLKGSNLGAIEVEGIPAGIYQVSFSTRHGGLRSITENGLYPSFYVGGEPAVVNVKVASDFGFVSFSKEGWSGTLGVVPKRGVEDLGGGMLRVAGLKTIGMHPSSRSPVLLKSGEYFILPEDYKKNTEVGSWQSFIVPELGEVEVVVH